MKNHNKLVKGGVALTLKQRRVMANMLQEDVAKELEVDQSAVSKWEKGETKPLLKYQRKLAALYDCSIEELFSDSSA